METNTNRGETLQEEAIRDKAIWNALAESDKYIAETFFKDAHWEPTSHAPYDDTQEQRAVTYAVQSATFTVVAEEYNNKFTITIIPSKVR